MFTDASEHTLGVSEQICLAHWIGLAVGSMSVIQGHFARDLSSQYIEPATFQSQVQFYNHQVTATFKLNYLKCLPYQSYIGV